MTRWTELNIGPFSVDTDGDVGHARQLLTEMEQIRWVLAGLLDDQNLTPVWPVRVVCSASVMPSNNWDQRADLRGEYLLALKPDASLPKGRLATLLLRDNTARLPEEVESGLNQLFDTLQAHGSRVSWGTDPIHPDLSFARMELFATNFDYSASFHIFLSSLKNGSSIRVAETNAFGRPADQLEKEAAAHLAGGQWTAASLTGRPLDPRRDFGEHSVPPAVALVYQADAERVADPNRADADYRSAVNQGSPAATLAYEGLADLARSGGKDSQEWIDKAIAAGSRSAAIYVAAATDQPADKAELLLKRATVLNPRWASPLVRQAALSKNPAEREKLLKRATELDRRNPDTWVALAEAQVDNNHAAVAQGSWIQAENAPADESERERIRSLHAQKESERLAKLEQQQNAAEDAAIRADRQAQRAQSARVRAAVDAANRSLDAESKGNPAQAAVPWNEVVPEKKVDGKVTKVDCLGSDARIQIRQSNGQTLSLLWRNVSELGLSCGEQKPPRRAALSYSADPDDGLKTAGTISSIRVWPAPAQ